jgi:hypothetical protein
MNHEYLLRQLEEEFEALQFTGFGFDEALSNCFRVGGSRRSSDGR